MHNLALSFSRYTVHTIRLEISDSADFDEARLHAVSHDAPPSILSRTAMLARPLRPQVRHLHASLVRNHLVGPSDPISNLRPVIYDDAVPEHRTDVTHPYSLREFGGDTREYQWKMQRQQLDAYNHVFWTEVSAPSLDCRRWVVLTVCVMGSVMCA